MLQSIQYVGSGPPTYIYSQNAVGTSNAFYHVFAAETSGYDARRERKDNRTSIAKKEVEKDLAEHEEFRVMENSQTNSLQEVYQKEYGKREFFLWKQR